MPTVRNNYQLQARNSYEAMTVRELIAHLSELQLDLPVVILSPKYGAFGSETPYTIAVVEEVTMPQMEHKTEATIYEDEETGETINVEEDIQIWPEWVGVVIQARG